MKDIMTNLSGHSGVNILFEFWLKQSQKKKKREEKKRGGGEIVGCVLEGRWPNSEKALGNDRAILWKESRPWNPGEELTSSGQSSGWAPWIQPPWSTCPYSLLSWVWAGPVSLLEQPLLWQGYIVMADKGEVLLLAWKTEAPMLWEGHVARTWGQKPKVESNP